MFLWRHFQWWGQLLILVITYETFVQSNRETLAEIDIDNDHTHDDWDNDDEDLDADMADPHRPADDDHENNSPKFFGTVEPITYTTITPWQNWREGMAALRNCTDWRNSDKTWEEFDEKRCDAIELFMATGPNGDQAGENAEAAEEIKDMEQDDKGLCTEDWVGGVILVY